MTEMFTEQDAAAYMRRQQLEAEGEEIANRIGDYVNHTSNPEFLILGLRRTHRTLQQSFMRHIVAWIEHLASLQPGQYDLRNEASVRFAKSITQTDEWKQTTGMPYV